MQYDAIVIGAGAAGLMAARELALAGKKTVLVEARDRIGGRIHTVLDNRFDLPVELGAEFVHGKLQPSLDLLKKAGIEKYEVSGEIWQREGGQLQEQKDFIEDYSALKKKFDALDHDISVQEFIDRYLQEPGLEELRFTLRNYVEGYYAADASKASTYALREELMESDDEQYRVEGGYGPLLQFLLDECIAHGVTLLRSHPVQRVQWREDEVTVYAKDEVLRGTKLLVTVPVGVLQTEKIAFMPALPQKMAAARQLGYGPVIKTILQFDAPFWKEKQYTQQQDLDKLSFVFSKAQVPTWWTYYPKKAGMITGWSAGPHALELADDAPGTILEKALASLSEIFDIDTETLHKRLKGWQVANWLNDPFACGAYSYEVVNGAAAQQELKTPEVDTVFFAGEGLFEGPEIGTVNAALVMGRDTAQQMIAAFKK